MAIEETDRKEMRIIGRIVGIFVSPRKTLENINQKPNWLIPFLIGVTIFLFTQFLTWDIQIQHQLAVMEAKDLPPERLEVARNQLLGPQKYIGFGLAIFFIPILWSAYAGLFLLTGNWVTRGKSTFKNLFSMIAWISVIGNLGAILTTFLIISKGTVHGIGLDMSVLLTLPEIGGETSLLYKIFSKIDLFVIWQIILWIIGLSVAYKTTIQKATVLILSLWGLWIVVSVGFSSLFGNLLVA